MKIKHITKINTMNYIKVHLISIKVALFKCVLFKYCTYLLHVLNFHPAPTQQNWKAILQNTAVHYNLQFISLI